MPVIVLFTQNIAWRRMPPGGKRRIGDRLIFTDNLVDENGAEVGQHSGFCTRVRRMKRAPDLYECQATLTLPEGTLTARGEFRVRAKPGQLSGRAAITGGTDGFITARGQVNVTAQSTGADRLEIDIR